MCDINVRVFTVFGKMLVINDILQASHAWNGWTLCVYCCMGLGRFFSVGMSWESGSFVIVFLVVIIGRVNNVGGEDIRIIIDNVEERIGICTRERYEASIDQGTDVTTIFIIRVASLKVLFLFET